jgi:flagellar hook assembly protein FlgD
MNARQQGRAQREKNPVVKTFIVWSIVCLALCASLAFSASAQQRPSPSQITITVSSQGITPTTTTANAGPIRLTIENQKAMERVTLRISNQSGELIREISVPDKSSEWKTEVELPIGQYVISDVSNSSASCRITVQAPPAS